MNLTARGWTLLGGGAAWCAIALVVGQRDLWWPGLFLAALPLASWLLLLPGTGRLRVERRVSAARIAAGDVTRVSLLLNPGGLSLGAVSRVRDLLPSGLGEPRWYGFAPGLANRAQLISYDLRPAWRGRYHLGPVEHAMADGLGLARSVRLLPGRTDLLVTPKVEPLANLRAASGVGLANDTTLLRTGVSSADDVLIREYRRGDDVRRIHWRSTARTGQLMVRREERAWDPSATVLVDNRARGYSTRVHDERFEWAVSAAASIALHLLADGFDLSLVTADGVALSPHRAGTGREAVVLDRLAELSLDRAQTLRGALAASNRGAEGQVLVAVLARVDPADVAVLTEAARGGRACWALLLASSAQLDASQVAAVRAAGWRCAVAGPGTSVATVWQDLGRGDSR